MKRIFASLLTSCFLPPLAACSVSQPAAESLYPSHLAISIGYWNIEGMQNNDHSDALRAYLENKFNISIEPFSVSWADYHDRYQILSATNSLPDIFASAEVNTSWKAEASNLDSMIANGSIRDLPSDLSAYPNIENALSLCGLSGSSLPLYYLPRVSFTDASLGTSDAAMFVRQDWMEHLKLNDPQNLDEFIQMAAAFANSDPDGNGVDDTLGYNVNSRDALGKWVILGIAPELNVQGWVQENGKYIPSFYAADYVKILKAYRKIYVSGGLDPKFYLKKSVDAVDDFARGTLGALEYKSSPSSVLELKTQWELYDNPPFEDSVKLLHIFPAEDGVRYSNSSNVFWSETFISSRVNNEKMQRILALMDYLLSDEGLRLTRYGLPGEDYNTNKNGEYQILLDLEGKSLSKALEEKYPSMSLFNSLASWAGTLDDFSPTELNYLRFGKTAVDIAYAELEWNKQNTVQVERNYRFLMMSKSDAIDFPEESIADSIAKVIIGTDDVETMWNDVLQQYRNSHIDEYIDKQNQKYQQLPDVSEAKG